MRWGQGAALSGVSNAMSSLTHAVKLKAGMVREKRLVFAGIDAAGRESPPRNGAAITSWMMTTIVLVLLRSMNRCLYCESPPRNSAAVLSWMLGRDRCCYGSPCSVP